jgi:hypothetical protein
MVADFLKFRGGYVIEFRQFLNSCEVIEQFLGRQIDLSRL